MPIEAIKHLAAENNMTVARVEKLWDKAKEIAYDKFEGGTDSFYAYAMGILKRMIKNKKLKEKAAVDLNTLLQQLDEYEKNLDIIETATLQRLRGM